MRADYELKHKLFGQQGSMWERQVDATTKQRVRRIVKEAGSSPILTKLDQTAASAVDSGKVLIEDAFFNFVDGNFAVVGKHQRDYSHHMATLEDGSILHLSYRLNPADTSSTALPPKLARITIDFLKAVNAGDTVFADDRDWYLVPVPDDITPLVIEGKQPDTYLINGIDFTAHPGYIAMTDAPALSLPSGVVRVCSAYKRALTSNAFVRSAPVDMTGGKFVTDYAAKTQSVEAFRRAAAEYAGLYVFQAPDIVLSRVQIYEDYWIYNMAGAGPIEIRYPHQELLPYQHVAEGFVVCNHYEVVGSAYLSADNPKKASAQAWGEAISLDGILPVKGISWDGHSQVRLETVADDPLTNTPHIRLMLDGSTEDLDAFWEFSRRHEAQTGVFLYDALNSPSLPGSVDFWDILNNFYGSQLLLALAGDHTPTINVRLWKYLFEYHPQSTNLLFSIKMPLPYAVVTDSYGIPAVDEWGYYVPLATESCVNAILSLSGDIFSLNGSYLVLPECPEGAPGPPTPLSIGGIVITFYGAVITVPGA